MVTARIAPREAFRAATVLFCLIAIVFVAGCSVDPVHARRAALTTAAIRDHALTCAAENACAAESPYRALAIDALTASTPAQPTHYLTLLDHGEDALLLRVHLIRAARKSIDVQTFIFAEDDSGYLILDELVKAARRGVKVRVLADQLFSLDDRDLLGRLARAHVNFELRVYNPTFHKARTQVLEFAAGILCCFFQFNQRMHDKLLLIDGEIGIAGGRNYENRYYDWDDEFDYRDRDVLVAGPAAASMSAAFVQFWNHPRAVALTRLRDVASHIIDEGVDAPPYVDHAYKNAARVAELGRRADDIGFIREHFSSSAMRVGRVDYFSDAPDKPDHPEQPGRRDLTRQIGDLLRAAKNQVVLQTPYLVISKDAQRVFRELKQQQPGLHIIVSTNSLAATDAFYVYALSHKYKKRYLKLGFEIHEFKPFPADAANLIARYDELGNPSPASNRGYQRYGKAPLLHGGVRVGLHAKSMVIDDRVTVIGSHNFDPRSDRYNTESGFIIHDRAFATHVRESILRDTEPGNAWTIARRPHAGLLSRINNAIADFSTALPLFDFWPLRYATSFELNPGCAPLAPGDTHFYDCYTAVGDFPEVDLPLKTVYTRMVTAFGAGLISIM